MAVNIGPSVESATNAGKAPGCGQWMQSPLVINDSDPVLELEGFCRRLLQGLQQVWAPAASFWLEIEVKDVLELIQVC